jgi:hypothetical protein
LDASPLSAREEFEQEIMVLYQAEYMVGGTCWLPSKVIENQGASLGRLATKDGFQLWFESQKERPRFEPMPIVEAARSLCLKAEEAVIHGRPSCTQAEL